MEISTSALVLRSSVPINSSNLHESSLHIYEPDPSYVTWSNIIHEGLNFSKVKLTNRKGTLSFNSHPSSIKSSESVDSGSSNYFSLCSFGNYVPIVYILDWNCFFRHHQEMFSYSSIVGILKNFDQDQLEREGSFASNQSKWMRVYCRDSLSKRYYNPLKSTIILMQKDSFWQMTVWADWLHRLHVESQEESAAHLYPPMLKLIIRPVLIISARMFI